MLHDGQRMSETDRTRLANERTFLAWWRTGIAALAAGLASARLVPQLSDSPHHWPYVTLGAVLAALGTICLGYAQWRRVTVDRAVAAGRDASPARFVPTFLAAAGVLAGLGLIVLILAGG
jgi:putative membrane protein